MHCTLWVGTAIRLKNKLTYEAICSAIEIWALVRCACMRAKTNLNNYMSVIYDTWFLEIQRNDIMWGDNQENPRHGLETGFGWWE